MITLLLALAAITANLGGAVQVRFPNEPGVVAVEAGTDQPGGREVFVGPLRRDRQLTPTVSTVDDLEAFAGRAAVVMLLRQPATTPAGHFGVGPQAQRELPPPAPEP